MSQPDRRRVLIVVQNTSLPRDRRVMYEATALVEAGYAVSAICPKLHGLNRSYERIDGVDVYRYPLPFEAGNQASFVLESLWCLAFSLVLSIRVAVFGPGFDVVQVCNPPDTFWPLGLFWRLVGRRFLFDHHDLAPEMYRAKFGEGSRLTLSLLRATEWATFRTADVVIATNESYRQVALERGKRSPADVFVVRNGPALGRLRRYEPDVALRPAKEHLLVYVGEICEQDGVDYLLRALALLREEWGRQDVHCLVIGPGPHQPSMKAYAAEIGVADLCTFTGWVDEEDWCRLLSSADIGVDPNPWSEWSDKSTMNKVLDYMYFGLPIVAFDLTEHRRSAGAAASYAKPNSERDLAERIDELLDDPDRRREMSAVGRSRMERELVWERSVPSLLAAYDQLFTLRQRSTRTT